MKNSLELYPTETRFNLAGEGLELLFVSVAGMEMKGMRSERLILHGRGGSYANSLVWRPKGFDIVVGRDFRGE